MLPDASLEIKDKLAQHQTFKIAPFKKDLRKTEPHKHNNYIEVLYLSGGKGLHTIDAVSYKVTPPLIFIIRKEQVHHWELTEEPAGYVLILKKAFIDNSLDNEISGLAAHLSTISCLQLEHPEPVENLFYLLTKEFSNKDNYNAAYINGLLKALFAKISGSIKPGLSKRELQTDLFSAFRALLSENTELRNSVAYYARQLNTTPQNLNAVCRKAIGQSAAEVIAEHLVSEAKRLLIYTNKTVSEIAALFEFHDTSHFIKYFKKATELTPLQFRTKN